MAAGPLVVVIDPHVEEREQIAAAIEPYYPVLDYGDLDEAVGRLHDKRPAVLVVDERTHPPSRRQLIGLLRRKFRGVPIILCCIDPAGPSGAEVTLKKPFRRSQLINALSCLTNKAIEASWSQLPSPHPGTLRRALDTFNGMSDLIETGQPLVYQAVVDTCGPVIEAVRGAQYKVLLTSIRGHDNVTYVHSLRVATLLALFGHTIGLREEPLQILATGGLLHDLGKMSLPQELLSKAGELSAEEQGLIRNHVTCTIRYLSEHSDVPKGVLTVAAQHHERLDGSGYPKGLRGEQLNDLARMAAIVDVFAALTEYRCGCPGASPEAALAVMKTEMRDALDQRLLNMFRDMLLDAGGDEWAVA